MRPEGKAKSSGQQRRTPKSKGAAPRARRTGRTRVRPGSKHQSVLTNPSPPELKTLGKLLSTPYLNCAGDEFPGLGSHNQHATEQTAFSAGRLLRSQTKRGLGWRAGAHLGCSAGPHLSWAPNEERTYRVCPSYALPNFTADL